MRYRAKVFVTPTAIFGLPEAGATVVPSSTDGTPVAFALGEIEVGSMQSAGWGTLSRYREPGAAVRVSSNVRGVQLTLEDNYLTFEFVSMDPLQDSPWKIAEAVARSACRSITLFTDSPMDFRIVSILKLEGTVQPLLRAVAGGSFTAYNTAEMAGKVQSGFGLASVPDPALEKALVYFHHGTRLRASSPTLREGSPEPDPVESLLYSAEAFLNYWKATTAIVGDRTKGDKVEERLTRIGVKDTHAARIEALRALRNDHDVAHYDVELDRAGEAAAKISEAMEVARQVIIAYANYLRAGGSAFSPRNP